MVRAIVVVGLVVVLVSVVVYQVVEFEAASYPEDELSSLGQVQAPPLINSRMLKGSERIGEGELLEPEDIAYDPNSRVIYTGCVDGWIYRITLNDSSAAAVVGVDKWVNTGGRPLGIALGHNGEVIVADADKGLLNITRDGTIEVLTDEAEGVRFKLTDAVDIGHDGTLYFTDASYKYSIHDNLLDFYEGRPYGRLMSYEPSTKKTRVLVHNLYFANGVVVSLDQSFVIVCETPMRRCKRCYIQGPRKGSVDIFVENLPGLPDNIRYDGEGQYWISLATEPHAWVLIQKYPILRKVCVIVDRYIGLPRLQKNAGAISVDLDGKPVAHYYDHDLFFTSSAIKIGQHLYVGSVVLPYIVRLDVSQYPATATV